MAETESSGSDDSKNNLWNLLPSFDPATDDIREYAQKVRFLHGVCPSGQRGMLAPRLAMMCKGTAWNQVRNIDSAKLTHPGTGVDSLLAALSSWEESAEMVTFEKFEKALYKVQQKADESTMSYTNRLAVAFDDLGSRVSIQDFRAFVLLRQSCLSAEDKKKILTMTGGEVKTDLVENAMRSLATRVLTGPNEPKKKVYPINFTEEEITESETSETAWHVVNQGDEDGFLVDDPDMISEMVMQGDADALVIQGFEQDLEDLFQSTPDLQHALVTYQEARQKITERRKFRGFWPTGKGHGASRGKGKGKKGFSSAKGGSKPSLLERIARTHCKHCGEKGHWRAECPNRQKESANLASAEPSTHDFEHVIVEEYITQDTCQHLASQVITDIDDCFHIQEILQRLKGNQGSNVTEPSWKQKAIAFLTQRLHHRNMVRFPKKSACTEAVSENPEWHPETQMAYAVVADGSFAILDTGASRSVIGSELVPSLLKDLPAASQALVKEKPSRVGFRFGNNQISYSHSQLQIPMIGNGKRIWLLIEVVPGATPFLMSIRAMKCLGAQIDLDTNQVFLKTLDRSLDIHESKNGLFMVRLSDLCTVDCNSATTSETIFASQQVSSSETADSIVSQSPCDDHAQPSRSHPDHQGHLRASDGEPQGPAVASSEPGRDSCQQSASLGSPVRPDVSTSERSPRSEEQDRSNLCDAATVTQSPKKPKFTSSGWSGFRPRMGSAVNRNFSCKFRGPKACSSNSQVAKTSPKQCFRAAIPSNATESNTAVSSSTNRPGESTDRDCNTSEHRELGTETCQLGKEMDRSEIPGSIRERSGVRAVDHGSHQQPDATHERLPDVLPESTTNGTYSLEEILSSSVIQDPCELLLRAAITNPYEQKVISAALKQCRKVKEGPEFDLLEVYASSTSRLTEAVRSLKGRATRFTKEDGDLSTFEGQVKLVQWIFELRPKHLWLSPDCFPWCAWSRFNQSRSLASWEKIHEQQEHSKIHLQFCSLLMKLQRDQDRHTHMEHPDSSGAWKQEELSPLVEGTIAARFDQCQMGLKHPQNHRFLKKRTTVRTTSMEMHQLLDERFCPGNHEHAPIAGSCKMSGRNVPVSRFAAFYPSGFAKRVAKVVLKDNHMIQVPVFHLDENSEADEPAPKRIKIEHPPTESKEPTEGEVVSDKVQKGRFVKRGPKTIKEQAAVSEHSWAPIFRLMSRNLPRVGAKEFRAGTLEFDMISKLSPEMQAIQVKACKGVERYMTGEGLAPVRKTMVMKRLSGEIVHLGTENWTELPGSKQRRKAIPSHIMICVFGIFREQSSSSAARHPAENNSGEISSEIDPSLMPVPPAIPAVDSSDQNPNSSDMTHGAVATQRFGQIAPWTPAAVSQSGPSFDKLSDADKGAIKKMHHNLGHPTAETLSKHLAYQQARPELIAGAKDYQCSSCMERRPPKDGVPGALKPARDFNHTVGIDGFEWKNDHIQVYVLHALDASTRFHLGRRTVRDSNIARKCMEEMWLSWAGSPQCMYFDAAGEFLAQPWQEFLQGENIQHKLSAAPWQRGQVERHGGIVKEMLNRMNQDKPIMTQLEFDACLNQCFRAKNSLSYVDGYSPEQCVLGKSTKIPASAISDENTSSHLLAEDSSLSGEQFRIALQRRTAAREAFLRCENSQALRRSLLRKSQGEISNWHTGQLCMFWSKRDAPNMLERGRWVGPGQVILQESRSIVWISYLNRLLRCARENLRPVSLKEYHELQIHHDMPHASQLERRAQELAKQLQDRSGTFQYRDLSMLDGPMASEPPEAEPTGQPEEEPIRRVSTQGIPHEREAHEIPVPDTPIESENEQDTQTHGQHMENDIPPKEEEYSPSPAPSLSRGETPQNPMEETPVKEEDAGVIYHANIIEPACDDCGDCILLADDETLWKDGDDPQGDCCQFEWEVPVQQLHKYRTHPEEAVALLANAAKKSHAEVQYKNLTREEKALFDVAKRKELKCWLDTSTVRAILKSKVHPSRIMGSRWVLTWKTCDVSSNGYKAKARLVVKGFQDPMVGQLSSDSPTLSRDGRMVLLQAVSSMKWRLQNFDITTAFLRGRSDGRELAMTPVPELKDMMGLSDDQVCLLEGNAYGRVDAPLLFYKELRKQLEQLGFTVHPLDNCLFLLRNERNPDVLDGILGTHVDDGIGGGNKRFEDALTQLQKVLPFGSHEYGKFRFTGLDMEQMPDFSIKISQEEYIHKISSIDVPKFRRKELESKASVKEIQDLRALCGSLQYAAVHSRPDIATKVAYLQKRIPAAQVKDLLEANKVLNEAKQFSHTSLFVRSLPFRELTFASFGDASFASESNLKAQQGLFIMACTESLAKNESSDFSPISWSTKQIGRVVRSTLSAEAYAMSTSIDKLNWIRCMWGVIQSPKFAWQYPETSLKTLPKALLITDCKSLYDLMTKVATPNCQEWRTTIEVMLIRQQAEGNADCRWISTAIMLADTLTKPMDASFLRSVLSLGRFRIYDEEQSLQRNANKRFGKTWIHQSTEEEDESVFSNGADSKERKRPV